MPRSPRPLQLRSRAARRRRTLGPTFCPSREVETVGAVRFREQVARPAWVLLDLLAKVPQARAEILGRRRRLRSPYRPKESRLTHRVGAAPRESLEQLALDGC